MASDKYANIATLAVTMSAANTLTFAELRTQVGIEPDRQSANAMIIDQIDYFPERNMFQEMTVAGDAVLAALCVSNAVTDLEDFSDRRILHAMAVNRHDLGTPASAWIFKTPLVHQFFPPLITADRSLFLGAFSVGLATAGVIRSRIYHRIVKVTQAEFIELAEVFRLVG